MKEFEGRSFSSAKFKCMHNNAKAINSKILSKAFYILTANNLNGKIRSLK